MTYFKPPIGGVNVSLTVALPDLPMVWQTEAGPMNLAEFRKGEVEAIADGLKAKLIQQWDILHEDKEARAARLAKAKEAERSGMAEGDRAKIGVDRVTLEMIGTAVPAQGVPMKATEPGTIGVVDGMMAAE